MSVSIGSASHGRRKNLDAEINLVPFIDLLSMCICFLLMTAVWMQIGSVQMKQSSGTEAPATDARQYEIDVKFTGEYQVQFALKKKGASIKKLTFDGKSQAELVTAMDKGLSDVIAGLGKAGAEAVSSALVTPKEGVSYGSLVAVVDQLRKHKIVNLGVVPVGGGR